MNKHTPPALKPYTPMMQLQSMRKLSWFLEQGYYSYSMVLRERALRFKLMQRRPKRNYHQQTGG